MTGTLHEDQYTFMIISHSFILRMRTVSDKRLHRKSKRKVYVLYIFRRAHKIAKSDYYPNHVCPSAKRINRQPLD